MMGMFFEIFEYPRPEDLINRELGILAFQRRVLVQAEDATVSIGTAAFLYIVSLNPAAGFRLGMVAQNRFHRILFNVLSYAVAVVYLLP